MELIKLVALVAELIAKLAVDVELDTFGAPQSGAHTVEDRSAFRFKETERSLIDVLNLILTIVRPAASRLVLTPGTPGRHAHSLRNGDHRCRPPASAARAAASVAAC